MSYSMFRFTVLTVALLAARTVAQTTTSCTPLNSTCPDDAALGTTYNVTFDAATTELDPNLWNVTAGAENIQFTDNGAELVITKSGDSVTAESIFYINFGRIEMILQASNGTGIISTFDLLSDDLDEIDLEIKGSAMTNVSSNWFGWGNQSQYNNKDIPVNGPQQGMHNYTIVWDNTQLQWLVDGSVLRTLPYAQPGEYPQTPSRLKFGIWAGGDLSEPLGTRQWAGGDTNWADGPFTMTIKSIVITDGSTNTSSYSYSDHSGSYQSVKSITGESSASKIINKKTTSQNVASAYMGLSTAGKIGVACGVIGGLLLCIVAFTVFCCIQRKKGSQMARLENKEWEDNQAELMDYRQRMAKGQFAVSQMGHGERY